MKQVNNVMIWPARKSSVMLLWPKQTAAAVSLSYITIVNI